MVARIILEILEKRGAAQRLSAANSAQLNELFLIRIAIMKRLKFICAKSFDRENYRSQMNLCCSFFRTFRPFRVCFAVFF